MKPTEETFNQLQTAYDFFNEQLFDNELPQCMILVHRKRGARGYFWQDQFKAARGKERLHEIALNLESFDRTLEEILSTLVHEMCHLWQHLHGKPSRGNYHNWEFATKMESVGLITSQTGEKGGNRTGQGMTHYIEDGGLFSVECAKLLKSGFSLNWIAQRQPTKTKHAVSKQKFTCPNCGQNAWAKPSAKIGCWDCDTEMES